MSFALKYGPWAVVAGASKGMGLAFGKEIARRGGNVVLVAEEAGELELAREEVLAAASVECRTLAVDLGDRGAAKAIGEFTAQLDVGLVVYNATAPGLGAFLERPVGEHEKLVDVNCAGPVVLCHLFGGRMKARGHGGIVLMGSIAGLMGTPFVAAYSGSKAFNVMFGQGLGEELAPHGVDVLVSAPGATATPNYLESIPDGVKSSAPLMQPDDVVRQSLDQLGRKRLFVPGWKNRLIVFLFTRVLPRGLGVRLMGRNTKKLYG